MKNGELNGVLEKAVTGSLNVLLVGTQGVGKTTIVKGVIEKAGLRMKYFSTPTLDPYVDLVGVPVPDMANSELKFFRSKDLEDCEVVFFDELNRAHPKVLNAVFEMIQFKSINGVKLPKLKMVWAAINPPGMSFQVEELDPALMDRFHIYLDVDNSLPEEWLKKRFENSPQIAKALIDWHRSDLSPDAKALVSPRRVEYLGMLLEAGIDPRVGVADKAVANFTPALLAKLKGVKDFGLDDVRREQAKFIEKLKAGDVDTAKRILDLLGDSPAKILTIISVFVEMPNEMAKAWARGLGDKSKDVLFTNIESRFPNAKKDYAKIYDVFGRS